MEIRNLITFTKVAEAGSLSQAARTLGYAQSTVTMQMQQLEQELGVPLYERVGKKIQITQAGQELLTYAIPIIRMSQEAAQIGKTATSKVEGTLRLGVLNILADDNLADRMNRYARRCPSVKLKVVQSANQEVLLDFLRHNQVDLLLTLGLLLQDADLIHGEKEQADFLRFYAAPGHPLALKKKTEIPLTKYPLLGREENTGCNITDDPNLALRITAREGAGLSEKIAVAPESMAVKYVEAGLLIPLEYPVPQGETYRQTLYHKNKWVTEAMNVWINMAGDR